MEQSDTYVQFTFNHADAAAETAFKDLLAKQIGLNGENINVSDTNILTNVTIEPPVLTADVDDYEPDGLEGADAIKIGTDEVDAWVVTGLKGGYDGRIITIIGTSVNTIGITSEDTNSAAENRFVFSSVDNNLTIQQNASVTFRYDGIDERWRIMNTALPDQSVYSNVLVDNDIAGRKLSRDTTWDLGTAIGVKIGTGTTQKLGFYNATPVVQPSANADTSGATLGDLETEVNQIKQLLRNLGLMAT
jgi:hypothetical protein